MTAKAPKVGYIAVMILSGVGASRPIPLESFAGRQAGNQRHIQSALLQQGDVLPAAARVPGQHIERGVGAVDHLGEHPAIEFESHAPGVAVPRIMGVRSAA
jgi:hypothetical protein